MPAEDDPFVLLALPACRREAYLCVADDRKEAQMQIGRFMAQAVHAVDVHLDSIRRYQTYRMLGTRQDTMLRVCQRVAHRDIHPGSIG
ncbi:hypothetical protein A3840_15405 [Devosia elaeis]|uniref:Uncharacterized protein n=2 Tax=Devosia elaeis TaxID=1770058 RepID=A0A178HPI9_9HYPH|nr:hypothetical protein A3840_15405 [Devosia elaeis]